MAASDGRLPILYGMGLPWRDSVVACVPGTRVGTGTRAYQRQSGVNKDSAGCCPLQDQLTAPFRALPTGGRRNIPR
jgi:hypothetical protein